jgi:hypothetical protein
MMADEDDRDDIDRGIERTRRRRDGDDDYDARPRRRRDDDEYFDERRQRPRQQDVEAAEFLIPTGVSAWSMSACYFGFFSCFLPVIGLAMALIALPSGIIALRKRKKKSTSYGAVTGDIRAWIGIVCSSLTILGHLILIPVILSK